MKLLNCISSEHAFAQPLTSAVENETNSELPPIIFPKENVTVGSGLPPKIFPKENVTVGDSPGPISAKEEVDKMPPLIFPKSNVSVPLVELPPLIFPDNTTTPINETALAILKAATNTSNEGMHILEDDYYNGHSDEYDDDSDEVEEVQANDNNLQKDNLEENYKSEMKQRPVLPTDEFEDDTEVDHPMLKNSHMLAIIGAVAALCVCLYLGIAIWRRIVLNRYGVRERLINEDDFYSTKTIHHNF